MTRNCPRCGISTVPGATFCDYCGFRLTLVQTPNDPAISESQGGESSSDGANCWRCGYPAIPTAAFCENCGEALKRSISSPTSSEASAWQPPSVVQPDQAGATQSPTAITGRLVVQYTLASLAIPPGKAEVIIGRGDAAGGIFPEVDLEAYLGLAHGVGRRHARLTAQGGQVYVEDLDSTNGTLLRGQRLLPGQRSPLQDGDELVLGRLRLTYHSH